MGSIHTANGFYVYNYLGDGVFKVNFAIPINGNEDLIGLIYKAIDNGTITDATSLDLYAKNLRSEQRSNYGRIADAFEKRYGNGWYGHLASEAKTKNRRADIKNRYGANRDASSRGAGGRNNGQEIQLVDGKTKLSLKEEIGALRRIRMYARLLIGVTMVVEENNNAHGVTKFPIFNQFPTTRRNQSLII